jgi:exonuclease III
MGTKIIPTTHQGSRELYAQLGPDPKAHGGIPPSTSQLIMMKIITWNIRGLNGRSKQRTLRDCIRVENLDILLLQETKCAGEEAEVIFRRCWRGCDSLHTDSNGAAGGLAILWNPTTVIIDKPFSTCGHIMAHFKAIGSTKEGEITNAYGPQSTQDKEIFLKRITTIKSLLSSPNWLLGGDFNIILTLEEKTGGTKRLDQDSGKFRALIDQLNLVDIETRNGIFTWSNRRSGHQHVACRLDRFLISEALLLEDPAIEANILPKIGSDHWPVSLCLDAGATPKLKPFRFEKFWLSHPDFHQLSNSWWKQEEIEHGTCMYKFQQRLKNFKSQLKCWNKTVFGNILQRMQEIEKRLEILQNTFIMGNRMTTLMKEEEELKAELEERKEQEEILWRQKSRVQWLKEGEKNTKFFHRSMVHRRYINKITQLEDAQGNPIREHNRIAEELTNYYKDLLTETNDDRMPAINKITRNIPSLITQEHNEALTRPITQEEVDQAVKEMPPGKSPSPDGFTTDFFHYCWPMIREEVWQVVEESRTSGTSPLNLQCHLPHAHPKGGKGHASQTVQTDSSL